MCGAPATDKKRKGTLQVKRTLPYFQAKVPFKSEPGYPSSQKDCHISTRVPFKSKSGYPSSKKDFAIFPSQGTLQVRARVPFKSKGLPYFNQGTLQVKIRVPFKSKGLPYFNQGTLQVKRTLPYFLPRVPFKSGLGPNFQPGYPSSLHSEMLPVLGLDTSRLRDGTHRATWD